jgi:hypothetical protein
VAPGRLAQRHDGVGALGDPALGGPTRSWDVLVERSLNVLGRSASRSAGVAADGGCTSRRLLGSRRRAATLGGRDLFKSCSGGRVDTYGQARARGRRRDNRADALACTAWSDNWLQGYRYRSFQRRFTPRRSGSAWSERNVQIPRRLTEEGRMRPPGCQRRDRLTTGEGVSATRCRPGDVRATEERGSLRGPLPGDCYRVTAAKRREARRSRIEQFVTMLARGETIHPPT